MNFNKKGFTLIELLIVIGIIAILAAAVIIAINPGQQFAAARDATRESHLNSINNAILSYQVDNTGTLPTGITTSPKEICRSDVETCPGELIDLSEIDGDYISSLPVDPQGGMHSDGTGYYIKRGSVSLLAAKAETREVARGSCPPVADKQENIYSTVQIGAQCWMAENLKTTTYPDGTSIIGPYTGTGTAWSDANTADEGAYAYPDGEEAKVETYGLLYNWHAAAGEPAVPANADGVQGICPTGWHLPTDKEWSDLEYHLGMIEDEAYDGTGWRYTGDVGAKLKEAGIEHWSSETCGDAVCNSSGFTALPARYVGTDGTIYSTGSGAGFWSSSGGSTSAWRRYLIHDFAGVGRHSHSHGHGFSVRCLRD